MLIASAVAENPRLVIADEPTPGLDASSAARILAHFRELAEGGAGVLFITHDLETALAAADRVAVFYAGETIEEAAAGDFAAEELCATFTQALWNAMPQHGFHPIPGAQPIRGRQRRAVPLPASAAAVRRIVRRGVFLCAGSGAVWCAAFIRSGCRREMGRTDKTDKIDQ